MSAASVVPETVGLTVASASDTMRDEDTRAFASDAFMRMRAADGFSHSRATAFQIALALIPGAIVLVATAALLRWQTLSSAISTTIESLAPGETSKVFRDAFENGRDAGRNSDWAAIAGGAVALLVGGTTLFGQIERGANRIYGIETDRPSVQKYTRAFLTMVSAGGLIAVYFLLVGVLGNTEISNDVLHAVWSVVRWLLGGAALLAAFLIISRVAPNRRQPEMPWLMTGALISVALSLASSVLLHLYLRGSSSFGETYGPLAGFLGLLLWAYAGSLSMYLGLAVSAQLEAVRSGRREPKSATKVIQGEPESVTVPYGTAVAEHVGSQA